jgi:hypothetical protein
MFVMLRNIFTYLLTYLHTVYVREGVYHTVETSGVQLGCHYNHASTMYEGPLAGVNYHPYTVCTVYTVHTVYVREGVYRAVEQRSLYMLMYEA